MRQRDNHVIKELKFKDESVYHGQILVVYQNGKKRARRDGHGTQTWKNG